MKRLSDRKRTTHWSVDVTKATAGRSQEARPKDYLAPFRQILCRVAKQGIPEIFIVLYLRVSSGKQFRSGNLDHQLRALRRRILELGDSYGVKVNIHDDVFGEDVSAWKLWKSARTELVKAAKLAKEENAILVALNTTKFVRNNHHQRGVLPTVDDFERLKALVGDVKLATVRYPDYHENRSADTIRGHKAREAKPGRPKMTRPGDKKRRRMRFKLPVIRLCKQGLGNREIARQLSLPEKTVRDWRERYRKYWDASFSGAKT